MKTLICVQYEQLFSYVFVVILYVIAKTTVSAKMPLTLPLLKHESAMDQYVLNKCHIFLSVLTVT